MSVLIKGMDMPKNCSYCPLRDAEWNVCRFNNLPANDRERQEWCPLIEIKEGEHETKNNNKENT